MPAERKAEEKVETVAERVAQVPPETRRDTITNKKAEAIVDILANTLAEVKRKTLSE